jgi:hypothetical protein
VSDETPLEEKIVALLVRESRTSTGLMRALDVRYRDVEKVLQRLRKAGRVAYAERKWRLVVEDQRSIYEGVPLPSASPELLAGRQITDKDDLPMAEAVLEEKIVVLVSDKARTRAEIEQELGFTPSSGCYSVKVDRALQKLRRVGRITFESRKWRSLK